MPVLQPRAPRRRYFSPESALGASGSDFDAGKAPDHRAAAAPLPPTGRSGSANQLELDYQVGRLPMGAAVRAAPPPPDQPAEKRRQPTVLLLCRHHRTAGNAQ